MSFFDDFSNDHGLFHDHGGDLGNTHAFSTSHFGFDFGNDGLKSGNVFGDDSVVAGDHFDNFVGAASDFSGYCGSFNSTIGAYDFGNTSFDETATPNFDLREFSLNNSQLNGNSSFGFGKFMNSALAHQTSSNVLPVASPIALPIYAAKTAHSLRLPPPPPPPASAPVPTSQSRLIIPLMTAAPTHSIKESAKRSMATRTRREAPSATNKTTTAILESTVSTKEAENVRNLKLIQKILETNKRSGGGGGGGHSNSLSLDDVLDFYEWLKEKRRRINLSKLF